MNKPVNLPGLYELVVLEEVDDLRAYACRSAISGAAEGTLIWAKTQTKAKARLRNDWSCAPGNLYCATILQLDFPYETAGQLGIVTCLSLGTALGSILSPMTPLRYRWPNDILIAEDKVAGVWIDTVKDNIGNSAWAIITSAVNIAKHPEQADIMATSINAVENNLQITPETLLEEYSRHFLKFVNQWADSGPESIIPIWKQRLENLHTAVTIKLVGRTVQGQLSDVNQSGDALIKTDNGDAIIVGTNEFFELN